MQALTEIVRAIGLFLLLVVSRIVLSLVGLVLLLGALATAVCGALGVGRFFHFSRRPAVARPRRARSRFPFHR